MGRAVAPVQTILLLRELAWRSQARLHGGFDANTQRLLNNAIRNTRPNAVARTVLDGEGPLVGEEEHEPKVAHVGTLALGVRDPTCSDPDSIA